MSLTKEVVAKVEELFGEKAILRKLVEDGSTVFKTEDVPVPEDHNYEDYSVMSCKGYDLWMLGNLIVKHGLLPTDNPQVLRSPGNEDTPAGYYGFSHRGGCLFTIGDKKFVEDFSYKSIADVPQEVVQASLAVVDDYPTSAFLYLCAMNTSFIAHGYEEITTDEECFEAALALAKDLS